MNAEVYINDKIEVKRTAYGGRACFASNSMLKGTHLLDLSQWIGSSISHEFRKEVCHFCLKYDGGKPMKVRISWADLLKLDLNLLNHKLEKKYKGSGLWFCTEECKNFFLSGPNIVDLILNYEMILTHFQSIQGKSLCVETDTELYKDYDNKRMHQEIESCWMDLESTWMPRVSKMKLAKATNQLPVIDEDHYSCIRFVIECLFNMTHLDRNSVKWNTWEKLQSNEVEKIMRFPVLLEFQIKVFKWVYTLAPQYRYIMTTSVFRHILGSEYGNSFGIWETSESDDDREYLGYMVHPEASYFNHSCVPNVEKKRVERVFQYILQTDVQKGEELCIDYKGILHLDVNRRMAILKDNWFFECKCSRCLSEL